MDPIAELPKLSRMVNELSDQLANAAKVVAAPELRSQLQGLVSELKSKQGELESAVKKADKEWQQHSAALKEKVAKSRKRAKEALAAAKDKEKKWQEKQAKRKAKRANKAKPVRKIDPQLGADLRDRLLNRLQDQQLQREPRQPTGGLDFRDWLEVED